MLFVFCVRLAADFSVFNLIFHANNWARMFCYVFFCERIIFESLYLSYLQLFDYSCLIWGGVGRSTIFAGPLWPATEATWKRLVLMREWSNFLNCGLMSFRSAKFSTNNQIWVWQWPGLGCLVIRAVPAQRLDLHTTKVQTCFHLYRKSRCWNLLFDNLL